MAHEVVVGALVREGSLLLVHRRAERSAFPDCWDLPGGHVEAGEHPTVALVRELREELGVEASVSGPPSLHLERQPHRDDGLLLDVWTITDWRGEPANTAPEEHDELRWVAADELLHLALAHDGYATFLTDLLCANH